MALLGDGSTTYVRHVSSITAPSVFTLAFWYRNAGTPTTGFDGDVVSLSDATLAFNATFVWSHTSSTKTFFFRESGGTYRTARLTSGVSADTWYHIACRYDGTNIKIYLNGTAEATTAAAAPSATGPKLAAFARAAGTVPVDNGQVAEVGYWNTALSEPAIALLAARLAPSLVYPQDLQDYWNFVRDIYPSRGGPIETTGTTVQVHPPIIYPAGPCDQRIGATAVDNAALLTSLSIGLGLSPAPSEMLNLNLALADALTLGNVSPGQIDLNLSSKIRMKVITPYLVTGRAKDIEGR